MKLEEAFYSIATHDRTTHHFSDSLDHLARKYDLSDSHRETMVSGNSNAITQLLAAECSGTPETTKHTWFFK